jgi:hypothetical protein
MLKFKFNYQQKTLTIRQEGNVWQQVLEEKQFNTEYGGLGFKLTNGWIIFTLYENKIRAFYKQMESPTWFAHYKKDLSKECPVIFTFTEADQVEKINGKWRKKHE